MPNSFQTQRVMNKIMKKDLLYATGARVLSRFSCVRLLVILWTVAHQAPLSKGFSRQEYWSGLPFPSPGNLPHPGIEPRPSELQADSLPSEPPGNKGAAGLKKHLGIDYTLDKGKEKTLQPLLYLWLGEHQAMC